MQDNVIVRPKCPGDWPAPPELALMIGSPADLNQALPKAGFTRAHGRTFLNSRLYFDPAGPVPLCIAGPFIGAPYAVILLETLIAWGVKQVIFFGWCGAIHPDVAIGDILVPTSALVADGTSPHYLAPREGEPESIPSHGLNARILSRLRHPGLVCHQGPVWTTDAVFRETPELMNRYRQKGALAVEMEAAALFAAGSFRSIEVSAVLAVSDELHTPNWRPGFGAPRFRDTRKKIIDLLFSNSFPSSEFKVQC